jgi:hypothetical protein
MVLFGVAFFWPGIVAEYILWTKDFWHPETITGTIIGPEDFIMTFTHVSLPAVVYKFVFQKGTADINIPNEKLPFVVGKRLIAVSFLAIVPILVLWVNNSVHSFLITSASMLLVGIYIAFNRTDLFVPMVWSGVLMIIMTLPIYIIGSFVSPDAVSTFWDQSVSDYVFFSIPATDIVWYFLLGFFMGGMYEFLTGTKLEDMKG